MRACSRASACALLIAFAATAPLAAQAPATVCRVEVANEKPNGDPLHPAAVYARFKGPIDRNEWGAIASALANDFRASTVVEGDLRARFQRELDEFEKEMRAVEATPDPADAVARAAGVRQVRFQIDEDPNEPGRYEIFKGTPNAIVVTSALAPPIVKELCYRSHAAQKILVRYGQPGRERTLNALGYYVTLWDNYNKLGYSQYPWELYLNGLWTITEGRWIPPRAQWVVAHPAIAIETTWPKSGDLRRLDIITFEAIGYLRYTDDRRSYRGVSLLVTLSASADPGYGALAHLGRIGKIGYVYHRRDDADRARHGAVFSIDLYKMLSGVPQRLQDAKASVEAMRDALSR